MQAVGPSDDRVVVDVGKPVGDVVVGDLDRAPVIVQEDLVLFPDLINLFRKHYLSATVHPWVVVEIEVIGDLYDLEAW